jgi:hypothetical protein
MKPLVVVATTLHVVVVVDGHDAVRGLGQLGPVGA